MRGVTLVFLIVLASAPVLAQAPKPTTTAVVTPVAKPGEAADARPVLPPLEPAGYTYDPASRRDPFVSLLRRGADSQRDSVGPRAPGLAGFATSEIGLKGTMSGPGGWVGIVQGVDNKTYIVHAGDKLLDGTVRAINADSLVILQQVNDPLSTQKQREVRKVLRQTEEAR